jgi:hypothetical protein
MGAIGSIAVMLLLAMVWISAGLVAAQIRLSSP